MHLGRLRDGDTRDHAGRRVADAEQAAFALRHDLEVHVRLVESGSSALEVAEGLPFGLPDCLPRCLYGHSVGGDLVRQRRAPPFFFLTRRVCAGVGRGAGAAVSMSAPVAASSFGGVREERFGPAGATAGAAATFGTRRRVTRPW